MLAVKLTEAPLSRIPETDTESAVARLMVSRVLPSVSRTFAVGWTMVLVALRCLNSPRRKQRGSRAWATGTVIQLTPEG